jgi:Tfp pilus assembly protein PilX
MPMPRVRFTVRRMMIAVAVVAVLIGVGLQIRRAIRFSRLSANYLELAAMDAEYESILRKRERNHRELAEIERESADKFQQSSIVELWRRLAQEDTDRADKFKLLAEYHASMKAKYQAAARRPWLHIEPDPPRPEL